MQTTRPVTAESVERRPLTAPPRPRRFFRTGFFILIGIGLVTASIIGSGYMQNPSGDDKPPLVIKDDASFAVGFGFVDVESRIINLFPVQPGEVVEIPKGIKENSAVKKGDVLFRMDDQQAKLNVQRAQDSLEDAKLKEKQAEQMPEQHQALMQQQESAIEAARQDRARADALYKKAERLYSGQPPLVSKEERDAADATLKKADEGIKVEEKKLAAMKLQLPQLKLEIERAKIDVSAQDTRKKQAEYVLEKCKLRAPCDGTVLRMQVSVGDVLGPNTKEPAIVFCPDEKRIIRVEVEQEFASKVKLNQDVTIQDDARQGAGWGGKVTRISDWYLQRRHILMEPRQFNDIRTMECIIEVNDDKGLKIGQRVRVTFGK